jgi:MoxR-like ATPase
VLEDKLRRRYSTVHIEARVAQVDEVLAQARTQHAAAQAREQALALRLQGRLWLPPELAQRLLGAHAYTRAVLQMLIERLVVARSGFAALPVEAALPDAVAPAPVALEALHA